MATASVTGGVALGHTRARPRQPRGRPGGERDGLRVQKPHLFQMEFVFLLRLSQQPEQIPLESPRLC